MNNEITPSENWLDMMKKLIQTTVMFIRSTDLVIQHEGKTLITMPTIIALLLVILCKEIVIPAIIISLLCKVNYTFASEKKE